MVDRRNALTAAAVTLACTTTSLTPTTAQNLEFLEPCVDLTGGSNNVRVGQVCSSIVHAETKADSKALINVVMEAEECFVTKVAFCNLPFVSSESLTMSKSYTFEIPLEELERFLCGFEDEVDGFMVGGDVTSECFMDEAAIIHHDHFFIPTFCEDAEEDVLGEKLAEENSEFVEAEESNEMGQVSEFEQTPEVQPETFQTEEQYADGSSSPVGGLPSMFAEYETPLTYTLEEVKYPIQRLTLEELNFCDLGWSGMKRHEEHKYHGALECPPRFKEGEFDPSCISCLREDYLQQGVDIWDEYANEESAARRREMFSNWFAGQECYDPEDTQCGKNVVVVAADDKYLPVLRHWWCNAAAQGLDKRELVVYAFEENVKLWAQEQGMFVLEPSLYNIIKPDNVQYTFKFALFPLFLDLLNMGKHVIFNDVDMVWTANMARKLPPLWPHVHLVSALAPIVDFLGLNSGVLSMRPTDEMIVFLETLMSTIPVFISPYGWGGDQVFWNHLLRHYAFRSLTWRPLPDRVLLRHSLRNEYSEQDTLAIHFIGANGGKDAKMIDKITGPFADILPDKSCIEELKS